MPWTQADADAVRVAIFKLATGARDVSVSYAGPPPRSISYQMVDLADLRALLTEITREVGGTAGVRLAATRNGLGGPSGGGFGGGCGGCW